jgi:hypothetical protein
MLRMFPGSVSATMVPILLGVLGWPAPSSAEEAAPSGKQLKVQIKPVPPCGQGEDSWGEIGGEISGPVPALSRAVIYAGTDQWYVQPWVKDPSGRPGYYTEVRSNGSFQTGIHLGAQYAVLLVDKAFVSKPAYGLTELPTAGRSALAWAQAPCRPGHS